jgi:hypothetical protein
MQVLGDSGVEEGQGEGEGDSEGGQGEGERDGVLPLRRGFQGILLGNPFTSYASGSLGMYQAMWGLQMIPKPAW